MQASLTQLPVCKPGDMMCLSIARVQSQERPAHLLLHIVLTGQG